MTVRYLVGDVFERMAELEDGSVDLILTSPPFLALRSYLPADHPDKAKEIGSEATPAEFIDVMLRLSAEWRRLLAPHGTLAVELGDTFSGSGGSGGDYNENGWREGQADYEGSGRRALASEKDRWAKSDKRPGWPLAKSLTLVPESYRFALAYGINPHTGQPSPAGKWRVRNVVRWVRPNPPVGALGDKFRPATSELVVACVSKDRWFDLDAVREDFARDYDGERRGTAKYNDTKVDNRAYNPALMGDEVRMTHGGAPPLDWWKISPKGYAGAHYAVWPSELCVKPIKAMCPVEVCRECGEPRRRITEVDGLRGHDFLGGGNTNNRDSGLHGARTPMPEITRETVGFTDCGHTNYRPGIVLDPFAGTGTTLMVAHGHGRDAVGIDLDERNAELARERVGPMFLNVE